MPDDPDQTPDPEQQPQGSKAVRELRETVDRISGERDQLKQELADLRTTQRNAGLARAGVKPDSYIGEAVLAVADRDGISSADDIYAVVEMVRAEARNGDT